MKHPISLISSPYRNHMSCGRVEICQYTIYHDDNGNYSAQETWMIVPADYVEIFAQPQLVPDMQPFGVWSKYRRNR